eukprot:2267846-Prorocentrum_lima.AAC.1
MHCCLIDTCGAVVSVPCAASSASIAVQGAGRRAIGCKDGISALDSAFVSESLSSPPSSRI